ncbi:ribokinase [Duganella sp. CT11-25]|uniref:ribokinase n=1 Tax=unclassified Duganella TaxID=2636909 RepID=UPI0039B00919
MICVFGSINVDVGVATPRLPLPGETVLGGQALLSPGGKGANQAHAARCFGAQVRMFGATGDDGFAATALAALIAAGVDISGVAALPGLATGMALIMVDARGENSIVVAAGANLAAAAGQVPDEALGAGDCLLLQLETDIGETMALARRARRLGCKVILNASPLQPERLPDLDAVDILIANAHELQRLAGSGAAPAELALALAARHGCEVLVTLGAQGALLADPGGGLLTAAAFEVAVRDTTGAGDTFAGVFAAAISEGADRRRAMRYAAAAAALACTRPGAQAAQPLRADIEQFMTSKETA